ncbi:MAG: NAD(P)-dependent oxidoreductase [Thermodesulfobacteriota bacterium]
MAVAGGGWLVYESALFRAPESETNAGAALDVLKGEPPRQGNPLLALPNVVVTLHGAVAGWSEEVLYRELREAATEIKLVLEGKNRGHPLNPEVLFGN